MEVTKEPDLIDGWWTSDGLYQLERRAVFCKAWICLTHRSRFTTPGDYISFDLAGFPILVILGKDNIVRAFHNVCRHRAYTITKKSAGSSLVLGCRYHGWSYNAKGDLIKAPQFDGIEGFDRAQNGLFKIRTCTDRAGFIHVNLDNAAGSSPAPDCERIMRFASMHGISSQECKWITGWSLEGRFNWKSLDDYTSTKTGTMVSPIRKNSFHTEWLASFLRRSQVSDIEDARSLHVSPITTITAYPGSALWVMMLASPVSATQCTLLCNVFASRETPTTIDVDSLKLYCASRIGELEQRYNELQFSHRPGRGADVTYLASLKDHLKQERAAGKKIFPAQKVDIREKSEAYCRAEKVLLDLETLETARNKNTSVQKGTVKRVSDQGMDTEVNSLRRRRVRDDSAVDSGRDLEW